jgi:hypothetical protein
MLLVFVEPLSGSQFPAPTRSLVQDPLSRLNQTSWPSRTQAVHAELMKNIKPDPCCTRNLYGKHLGGDATEIRAQPKDIEAL